MTQIKCRLANADDADLLFSWVNDTEVRNNSFSTEKISYQEHVEWFSKMLSDDSVEIYIYYIYNEPIGQIRLIYSKGDVIIDYSIAKKYRGQGFGKLLIHDIEKIASVKHPEAKYFLAKVKADNIASQKIFEDNKYSMISNDSGVLTYRKEIKIEILTNDVSEDVIPERERERVLLLTNNRNALKLFDLLTNMGEDVLLYSGVLSEEQLTHMNPKIVVSYNYKYIISENIITIMNGNIVNLHISYLPWNKGSDPNFWSFIDNTPKGVTIHKIDNHLDTGNILYQKEIYFNEDIETFRTTYNKLNDEIVSLLVKNWNSIKNNETKPFSQIGKGTYHKKSDFNTYTEKYPVNFDETITKYKNKYNIK